MTEVTIKLPNSIEVALGDSKQVTRVDIAALIKAGHVDVIAKAAVNGFLGAINNISRGKDDNGCANSDDVWAAARQKKVDVWMKGDWAAVGRGESAMTALKEHYIDERRAATSATRADVEKAIKATVKQVFGDKESATFARFLDAVAQLKTDAMERSLDEAALETWNVPGGTAEHRDYFLDSTRSDLEEGLAKRAYEAKLARDEAAKIEVDATSLGF